MVWYGGVRLKCERDMRGGHCGKVGGRSDESAPENDTLGVWAAGQVHGRCYRMHMLDQISTLGAVADSGGGLWGAGSRAT